MKCKHQPYKRIFVNTQLVLNLFADRTCIFRGHQMHRIEPLAHRMFAVFHHYSFHKGHPTTACLTWECVLFLYPFVITNTAAYFKKLDLSMTEPRGGVRPPAQYQGVPPHPVPRICYCSHQSMNMRFSVKLCECCSKKLREPLVSTEVCALLPSG